MTALQRWICKNCENKGLGKNKVVFDTTLKNEEVLNMKTLNKILMFILSVALLSTVIGIDKVNAETGTKGNIQEVPEGYTPIYDIADLYAIRNNPSGNYILMNDINMAEATGEGGDYDCGSGWDSIETFSGVLEGNGYRIIGMQIFGCPTGVSPKYCGLFEVLSDATIQNLAMQDVNINIKMDNGYYVGAIAGRMDGSTIKNCWVSGNIELANLTQPNDLRVICAGGLVGRTTYSTGNSVIKDCYNIACITLNNIPNGTYAESSSVGGLVGCDYSGGYDRYTTLLQNSYNCGKISINKGNTGSLLGTENNANYQPAFIHCYYLGNTADKAFGKKLIL